MNEIEKYLFRYYQLERLKRVANDELQYAVEAYNVKAEALLSPSTIFEIKTGKTNRISDPVQDAVIKMVDVYIGEVDKAKAALEQIIKAQAAIKQTVEKADLNAMEKSYVIMRYFKGNRSWQTAMHMQYSERQANRYRNSALNKIRSVLKDGR